VRPFRRTVDRRPRAAVLTASCDDVGRLRQRSAVDPDRTRRPAGHGYRGDAFVRLTRGTRAGTGDGRAPWDANSGNLRRGKVEVGSEAPGRHVSSQVHGRRFAWRR